MKERIAFIGAILLVFGGCSFLTLLAIGADSIGTHLFFGPEGDTPGELLLIFAFAALIGLAPAVVWAFARRPSLLDSYSVRRFLHYFAIIMLIAAGAVLLSSITVFRHRIVLNGPGVHWGITLAIPFLVLAATARYVLLFADKQNRVRHSSG